MVKHGEEKPGISFNSVAENSIAKIVARYVMPLLIAGLGYFITDKLSEIKDTTKGTWQQLGLVKERQGLVINEMTKVQTSFTDHAESNKRSFDNIAETIRDHEVRIRALQAKSPQ